MEFLAAHVIPYCSTLQFVHSCNYQIMSFALQQELEAEDLDNQLLEPAPVPASRAPARAQPAAAATDRMPAVPAGRPAPRPKQKTAEELELEALEAEMAA